MTLLQIKSIIKSDHFGTKHNKITLLFDYFCICPIDSKKCKNYNHNSSSLTRLILVPKIYK